MRSHSIFSSVFRNNLRSETATRLGYDLIAGLSYITVLPNTLLTQFSQTLTSKGVGSGLLGLGLVAGGYYAYSDLKKMHEDNEKILKNYLFLSLYASHILESNHLFDTANSDLNDASSELDEKKQVPEDSGSGVSTQDQRNIEILRELKKTGFSSRGNLTPKQGRILQRYLFAMRTQTEDNFNEFYKSIRDFHLYKEQDAKDSRDLREFWRVWEKEKYFTDNLIAKAIINASTWEEACCLYAADYQEENLKHLQKQIFAKLKQDKTRCDAKRFLRNIKSIMAVLSKFPIDNAKFTKLSGSLLADFSGASSQLLTEVALYLDRLAKLKEKIEAMTLVLSPFYNKNGLIFMSGFEAWLTTHTIDYYYLASTSNGELLEKAFVWAVSSLGVYDTLSGLSASSSQDNSSQLFDWTRMLVGCVSTALGTLVWNKLEKVERMRQIFFSRLHKQLDEIQLLVKLDKNFSSLPLQPPLRAIESSSSVKPLTLEVDSKRESFKL